MVNYKQNSIRLNGKNNSEMGSSLQSNDVIMTNDTSDMDKRRKVVCIYVIGSVLIACGLLVLLWWYFWYIDFVSKKSPLVGSDSLTFPLSQISVYMFNWTNADAILMKKDKVIKLEEIGPYVYRLDTFRENFTWNSNSTLTYSTRRQFHFIPDKSTRDPYKDVIISPNVPLISFSYQVQNWSIRQNVGLRARYLLDGASGKSFSSLYIQKSVQKLLFEGYTDEYLSKLNKQNWNQTIPHRFAGFLQKNNTNTFNVYTGEANLEMMGLVYTHNYSTNLPVSEGSCVKVNGSLGDFWPVDTAQKRETSLFIPDFCSSIQLSNKDSRISVHDIPGIRFIGDKKTFDYSEDKCYCSKNKDVRNSNIGIRNLSSCLEAPVILSFPHFYAADPCYSRQATGLKPNEDKHASYMTFHEHDGGLLEGASRMQLNVHLRPVSVLKATENLTNVILPVTWFEEKLDPPSSVYNRYFFLFFTMEWILSVTGLILLISGLIIVAAGYIISNKKSENSDYKYSRGTIIKSQ